jgi:hypothetical protein
MTNFLKFNKEDIFKSILSNPLNAGLWLYLVGLLVYQLYLLSYNILSFDLLKPVCILIGVYVFLLVYVLPNAVGLLLLKMRMPDRVVNAFLFIFLNLLGVYIICSILLLHVQFPPLIYSFILSLCIFIIYFNFKKRALSTEPLAKNVIVGVILFCFVFSKTLYKKIPWNFGGGQPATVSVLTEPDSLLANPFSISQFDQLLYESEDSYYFKVDIRDSASGKLTQITIKKIPKSSVKRLNYIFSPTLNFFNND